MTKSKELAKNTVIITVGKISTQFLSFFLLPLYTALLTTDEYGSVDIVNTYVQLILPIVILQMDQSVFRFMIKGRDSKENTYKCITTGFVSFIFQVLIFSAVFFVISVIVKNKYAIYLYINVIAMALSSYSLQMARGIGDNISYSIASFLSGILTIGCNILFIAGLHMHAEGMLISSVVGNVFASLFALIRIKAFKFFDIKLFDKKFLKTMLRYSWPLIPNALIWWVVNASDRSIVLFFLGTSANGILAVSHKFPSLIMTIYNIFHLSWTESAALHLGEQDKNEFFSEIFDIVFKIFSSISILLIAFIPFIFNYFINENFLDSYYQVPIYSLASFFNVIVGLYSVVYIAEMRTGEIAKTSLFSGIINLVINIILIRFIGLYAASLSSAIAFGSMALYRALDVRKYIKQKVNYFVLITVIILFVMGFVSYYYRNIYIQWIYLIIALVYTVFLNWKIICKIISLINSFINRKKQNL